MKVTGILVILAFLASITSCASNVPASAVLEQKHEVSAAITVNANESLNSVSEESEVMVGGWAPAFFSDFNTKELSSIVDDINSGRIKKATINYPAPMSSLAIKIRDYLQSATKSKIGMDKYQLTNSDTVTYNMKQVVVTLYFNANK